MLDRHRRRATRIVVLSADADLAQAARATFEADARFELAVVGNWLDARQADIETGSAAVVIVDLNKAEQEELSGLQNLMGKVSERIPVIAVLQDFNETLARNLVQMRVADLLVKPVTPNELARVCLRIAQLASGGRIKESKIFTFLPVAGGVGTTTLAIQSAMTLLNTNARNNPSTCLVDLNFNRGASAAYLDLEPLLDLREIEPNPERLDRKLLEGMMSHHSSGLAVIATGNYPAELRSVDENIVMRLLNVVCQSFDHVVIDMPREWQPWSENVLRGSNRLFLVSEMTVPGVQAAKQFAAVLADRLVQGPRPKVIVNRFERRLFTPGLQRRDLMRALGEAFAGTVPYNHRLVREAIDRGLPLDDVRGKSNVAVALKKLILTRASSRLRSSLPLFARGGLNLGWARR